MWQLRKSCSGTWKLFMKNFALQIPLSNVWKVMSTFFLSSKVSSLEVHFLLCINFCKSITFFLSIYSKSFIPRLQQKIEWKYYIFLGSKVLIPLFKCTGVNSSTILNPSVVFYYLFMAVIFTSYEMVFHICPMAYLPLSSIKKNESFRDKE